MRPEDGHEVERGPRYKSKKHSSGLLVSTSPLRLTTDPTMPQTDATRSIAAPHHPHAAWYRRYS